MKKPEGSSLVDKAPMFESEEEDDPEIKRQIKDALDAMGLMEELMLSEHDDESKSESSGDDGKDDLDETKRYYEDQEEETGEPELKPSNTKAVNTDPVAILEGVGNPAISGPDAPSGNTLPTKGGTTKGKGPSNENSSKAPSSKLQRSAAALGVQEHAQSTFFGAATLAQATSTEEDTARREAGIALSRHVTTLTTEHERSTVSDEIFRTLIPACFQRIHARTEATFSEVHATLPSLLCRFVALD